jgi:hypothetical protein
VTDLASLTADELAEKVATMAGSPDQRAALAELVRRVRVGDALLDIADAARDALAVMVEYHEDLNVTFLLADKLAVLNTNEEDA